MIELARTALLLLAALAYAREHDLDGVQYHTDIGACRVIVWTNGNPHPQPLTDYVWIGFGDCNDLGAAVQRDVAENNSQ